jgi:iron complex transport system ATP-binding protein
VSALAELRDARVLRAGRAVLDGVSVRLEPGARVAVVGANGSGKSTLLRAMLGLAPLAAGEARLGGQPLGALSRVEIARRATLVLQDTHLEVPITVRDLVELGRYPHRGTAVAARDQASIESALARVDLASLGARDVRTLSGGELQRAHLARALAQDTQVLLLDEPTASLDLGHQLQLLEVLEGLSDEGRAVCVVLHDLALAARWAARVLVLESGRAIADAPPHESLEAATIERAFGARVRVVDVDGALAILPAGAGSATRMGLSAPPGSGTRSGQ